jgi:hypothetical protein
MRRPGDNSPDPAGGRAAERLREFLRQHGPRDASEAEQEAALAEETREQPTDPNGGQTDSGDKTGSK